MMKPCSPSKFRRLNKGSPRSSHGPGPRTPGQRTAGPRTSIGPRSCVRSLMKPSSEAKVKVVVRVRPESKKEHAANSRTVVKVVDEKMLIFDPQEEKESSFFYRGVQQKGRDMLKRQNKHTEFLFDRVFGFDSTNQQVFEESTKDIVTSVLDGYNCSVFVYGATGAGKTFTMLGSQDNPGIMFLTMVSLFQRMEELKVERDFEMGVSYLEVYNETVHDLITGTFPLYLREDANGVFVSGLQIEPIHDTGRLFQLLAEGNKNRTQHPTDANAESSRSHAVFQVYLKMTAKGSNQTKMVKLSMIDLAGSERGSATNFSGARFKEGSSINKSLLALGNCINKLADGLAHIPYRDSKLTRILKDSLGGNCRTVMIANVSPCQSSFEDTLNTLRYAKRAKMIKSTVKKNIVSVEMHVSHYIKMVEDLKAEVARLKADLSIAEASKCTHAANAVHLTPVKEVSSPAPTPSVNRQTDCFLETLLDEVEKIFSERQELQRRYLQMDSKEKVLKWRMECKQRSIARVEQLSDTPTNTNDAKSRAARSLKQFCGQLESAVDCQEGLAAKQEELMKRLQKLRAKASALGLEREFTDKVEKMDLELQNVELLEQQAHLQKVITLLSKEKDDQDQVMTELSAAFRRYYNLLRGHGHMTATMLVDHKALVRRFEGLKTVNWQEVEESEANNDPPPLDSISKLSLGESTFPVIKPRSPSPLPLLEKVEPASTSILKPSDGDDGSCEYSTSYKINLFDIDRIKRDIERISSMRLAISDAPVNPVSVEETLKSCALNDSVEDDEFSVQGKFAHFNATFEKVTEDVDLSPSDDVDKIDATIHKVDNLLNESYTIQARSLNITFDGECKELNKTFDKGDAATACVAESQKVDSAGPTLNVTFTNDDAKEDEGQAEEVVDSGTDHKLTPPSVSKERTSLDTTYQLLPESRSVETKAEPLPVARSHVSGSSVSRISPTARKSPSSLPGLHQAAKASENAALDSTYHVKAEASRNNASAVSSHAPLQQGHKFVKPSAVRANAPSAKRPKVMLTVKKPLQESNILRRDRTPLKGTVVSTKFAVPGHVKAPIAANATCMSLERKFPLHPKLKSKTLIVNKENGAPRKC